MDYQKEVEHIIEKYRPQIEKVFSYEYCELDSSFLGFLDVYDLLNFL